MKTITENVLFFLSKTLSRARVDEWKRRFLKTTTSSALDRYKLSRVGCGDKNGHEIIYRFRLVGPKAIQNWLNFWAGIFLKKRKFWMK